MLKLNLGLLVLKNHLIKVPFGKIIIYNNVKKEKINLIEFF